MVASAFGGHCKVRFLSHELDRWFGDFCESRYELLAVDTLTNEAPQLMNAVQ
jgi:hypothetical protein